MKRNSMLNPKTRPNIRSSSVRGITGVRNSIKRFGATDSLRNEDMNRLKRVKLPDPEYEPFPKGGPDASSMRNEATDAPKTSEYAFFKKYKKDACSHSYSMHTKDNHLKNVGPSDCTREVPNIFKQSYKDSRSSLTATAVVPMNHKPLLSPPGDALENSEVIGMVEPRSKGIKSTLSEKVIPINHHLLTSPFGHGSKNSGTCDSDKGVFAAKRQKLHQWVADTSLPGVYELSSQGFDLVSVLLSQLFPERNEHNCCMDPKSRQAETDAEYQLPSFSKSATSVKESHWTPTRDLVEFEHGSYVDDHFWPARPSNLVLPELEIMGPNSPSTSYGLNSRLDYKHGKSLCEIDGGRMGILRIASDSSFHLPYEGYGSINSDHLSKLEDLHEPNGYAFQREPRPLLLGSDFNNEKDERNLPNTCHDAEMNLCPLASSWDSYGIASGSSLHLPYEGYGSIDSDHLRKLEDLHESNGYAFRQPRLLLLGSDFNNEEDERNLPITCHDAEMKLCPLASSWGNDSIASDSSFHLPYEGYGSIDSDHLSKLEDFRESNGHAFRPESRPLLLGLDFNNDKDEQNLRTTCHYAEMNLFPTLASLWGNYGRQSLHDRLDVSSQYSSSLFSRNSSNLASLSHSHSASFQPNNFEKHLEDEKYLLKEKETEQLPLTFSSASQYLRLVGDCVTESIVEGSSAIPSPPDHPWYVEVFGETNHCGFETLLLPTEVDIDRGCKYLPAAGTFAEQTSSAHPGFQFLKNEGLYSYFLKRKDRYASPCSSNRTTFESPRNGHEWSLTKFQTPEDKDMGRVCSPLLLDNPIWDRLEEAYDNADYRAWKYM